MEKIKYILMIPVLILGLFIWIPVIFICGTVWYLKERN